MDYKARIEELASSIGARMDYRPGMPLAQSYSEPDLETPLPPRPSGTGKVVIPPFGYGEDDKTYWVALHELGHLASRHLGAEWLMFSMPHDLAQTKVVEQEAEAWLWGIDQAGGKLDPAGRWALNYGMGTYLRDFPVTPGPSTKKIVAEMKATA